MSEKTDCDILLKEELDCASKFVNGVDLSGKGKENYKMMGKECVSVTDRIFELLRVKNVSQKELADLTGISTSAISDWKHKGTTPSAVKVQKICEALGVMPEDILGKKSNESKNQYIIKQDNELYEFVKLYDSMDIDVRERILAYAFAMMGK